MIRTHQTLDYPLWGYRTLNVLQTKTFPCKCLLVLESFETIRFTGHYHINIINIINIIIININIININIININNNNNNSPSESKLTGYFV